MYRVFLRSVNMVLGWQYTLRSLQFVFHECNFCRVYLCFEGSQGMKQLCAPQGVNIYVSGPWVYYIEILERTVVVLFASQLNLYDNLCIFAMWTFLRSSYLNIACGVNFDDISSNIHLWRNRKCFSRLCISIDIDIDIQIKVHLKTNSAILNFNRIRYRFECAVYVSDSHFEYFKYRFRVILFIFEKEFNYFSILTKINTCKYNIYIYIYILYKYVNFLWLVQRPTNHDYYA